MKKIIVFGLAAFALTLNSCSETPECACLRETTEKMAEARENGYEGMEDAGEIEACTEVEKKMEGLSAEELEKAKAETEKCPSFAEFEKEQELLMEFMKKKMTEGMQNMQMN